MISCFWGQQSRKPISCQELCRAAIQTTTPPSSTSSPFPCPSILVSSMALRRQVKNFVKNYSEAEVKVREATSNDPWGPSSSLMLDISDLTFNTVSLSEIMSMLWQRLNDHGKNWRHVYKSLTLMDYLIKNGSKKVIQLCREGFFNIQTLKDFHHIDEAGKDQGYYVREKSKQVIALLMDEQLLHKEREVACRTRRRTSYSMTFPKRLPGTSHSPLPGPPLASDISASENKHKPLKVSRLHLTKSASKTELRPEPSYCVHMPSRSAVSQEALPLKISVWKSAEDLMVFYDEEPKQLLPPPSPTMIPPTSSMTQECEEGCSLWDSDAVPVPLGKSPSLHTNLSLGKRLDSLGIDRLPLSNFAMENTMQQSLEHHSPQKNCDALETLQGLWPSGREEVVNANLRVSKSDPFFQRSQAFFRKSQASVETLYMSPSFKTIDTLKENINGKEYPKTTQSSSKQFSETNMTPLPNLSSNSIKMEGVDLNPFARHDSAISEGTSSSFSTFSVSSPDLVTPENSLHLLALPSGGRSLRPSSHGSSSSSALFKEMQVKVNRPFAPCLASSDEDESDTANLLNILPNSSRSVDDRTLAGARGNWVTFPAQNIQCLTSVSDPTSLVSKQLPEATGANTPILVLLGEIKNAIGRLHGDLSTVVRELRVINGHLVSLEAGNSQQETQQVNKPPLPGAPPDGHPSQF